MNKIYSLAFVILAFNMGMVLAQIFFQDTYTMQGTPIMSENNPYIQPEDMQNISNPNTVPRTGTVGVDFFGMFAFLGFAFNFLWNIAWATIGFGWYFCDLFNVPYKEAVAPLLTSLVWMIYIGAIIEFISGRNVVS